MLLEVCPGRLRAWRHRLLALPVALAGSLWFGAAGALPLLLIWWRRRRDTVAEIHGLDLSDVRRASLGRWRTRLVRRSGVPLEIFHDELDPGVLASLRRSLKRQLAAGFSTSRRSEKPGNRIVSSDRGSMSG